MIVLVCMVVVSVIGIMMIVPCVMSRVVSMIVVVICELIMQFHSTNKIINYRYIYVYKLI